MQTIEKVKELAKGYDIVPVYEEMMADGAGCRICTIYERSIEIAAGRKKERTGSQTTKFYVKNKKQK